MKTNNQLDDNKTLSFKRISEILKNGDFDKLISQRESGIFEAKKKQPYDLPKRKAIFETIKDIASLANSNGGYIICGLITEKRPNSPHDYVKTFDLIRKEDFYDEKLITGIVLANIYPKIDIKIEWYPNNVNPIFGLGVIIVPPQDESKKFFIVKITEIEGEITKEFFGVPIRTDDNITWLTAQELHKLSKLSPGNLQQFHQSLSNQIEELKEMVRTNSVISSINIDNIPAVSSSDSLLSKIEETIYGNK